MGIDEGAFVNRILKSALAFTTRAHRNLRMWCSICTWIVRFTV
jgi:hypothetical protein